MTTDPPSYILGYAADLWGTVSMRLPHVFDTLDSPGVLYAMTTGPAPDIETAVFMTNTQSLGLPPPTRNISIVDVAVTDTEGFRVVYDPETRESATQHMTFTTTYISPHTPLDRVLVGRIETQVAVEHASSRIRCIYYCEIGPGGTIDIERVLRPEFEERAESLCPTEYTMYSNWWSKITDPTVMTVAWIHDPQLGTMEFSVVCLDPARPELDQTLP